MKKLILLIIVNIFILQSCGEDKKPIKTENNESKATAESFTNNSLKFEINADFPESESPIIFWRTKDIEWFEEKNTVSGGTNGFDGNQTISFIIPNNIVPSDFRFDISSNPQQKDIKVNFIKIEKENREFYVFGDELDKYFTFNEFISYDKANKKLSFKSIDGNYDPFLNTTNKFLEEFNKIYYNY